MSSFIEQRVHMENIISKQCYSQKSKQIQSRFRHNLDEHSVSFF